MKRPKVEMVQLADIINGIDSAITEGGELYPQRLPYKTTVFIYNISTAPYTILDFGCLDRTGLFCEIIEVLARYDINIEGAYLNTIGNVVSNIFYITHNGKKLDDQYIEYLRNNLELEVRDQGDMSY
jgi:UTP:GlnB (protein PII) uridylyltransferase